MRNKLLCLCAAVTATAFVSPHASGVDFVEVSMPDKALNALFAEYGYPTWDQFKSQSRQRDYLAQWEQWSDRNFVKPFEARLENLPLPVRKEAVNFVAEGIRHCKALPTRNLELTPEDLLKQAEAQKKAGVEDPLIDWIQAWATYRSTGDYDACRDFFSEAVKTRTGDACPPVLRYEILMAREGVRIEAKLEEGVNDRRIVDTAMAAVADPEVYRAEDDVILVENLTPLFRWMFRPERKVLRSSMEQLVAMPGRTEWARLVMEGMSEQAVGWVEGRSKGFEERERREQESVGRLREAFDLQPERSPAAVNLMLVAPTEAGGENYLSWLERALAARVDDPTALKYFLNRTSRAYGARSRELLAFGLWCGSSKKYDTDLPWHMLTVFDHMIDGGADWREICKDPLVKPVLLEVCQQQVKLAPTAVKRGEACAELGVFAWMCGESALAASAFQESPPSFPTRARRLAVTLRLEERAVRGGVSIDLVGKEKAWQEVLELYKDASLKEALAAAQELLKELKGDGADLVAAQIEAIKFEQALATGAWVSLKVDSKLLNWHMHKGPWEAGEDGALVQKGRGEPAFIRYRGRVGAEFEIEGRFEVRGRKDRNGGLGTTVSYRWDEDAEHFITCLHSGDESESKAFLMEGYYRSSLKGVPVKGGAHQGKFRVVGKDGKISFYVNGEPAFVDAQPAPTNNPSEPLPLLDDGGIGFCNYKFPAGQETRIYDMRVRTSHAP